MSFIFHNSAMKQALDIAKKSECQRRQVGCVAINKNNCDIIGAAYNTPILNCKIDGCYRKLNNIPSGTNNEACGAIHAEQLLVCNYGHKLIDNYVYITHKPCITCLKLLIGCGVKDIFYKYDYPSDEEIFNKLIEFNDVKIKQITD